MKRKIMPLVFCLFLFVGIAGCSSTGNSTQTESTPQSTKDTTIASDSEVFKNAVSTASDDDTIELTFVTNYGETIDTMEIAPGTTPDLSSVSAPDISGLSFKKWYLDRDCTQPYTDGVVFARSTTLYAGYRSNGSSFSDYLEGLPTDTSFELYSDRKITSDNLSTYIAFSDIYSDAVTLSIEVLSEEPSLTEEDLAAINDEDIDKDAIEGSYTYRLYAEDGFVPGGLYSITALLPEKALLLSVNGTSLTGNDASTFTFRIAEEKMDDRQENANVIHLESDACEKLTKKDNGAAEAVINSSVSLKKDDVIYLPDQEGNSGAFYKVASISGNVYQLQWPDSSEVWDTYQLSVDQSDVLSSEFELASDIDSETLAHQITSSIGYAAYVDAAIDSVRNSSQVQDFLQTTSQENIDSVMNLRAVDFGFGPEELQKTTNEEKDDGKDFGTLNIQVLKDGNGAFNGLSISYENSLDFDIGKSSKSGLGGTVTIGFSIKETCSFAAYSKMIAKNSSYKSMTDDWTRTGVMPKSETEFTVNASLALSKDDGEDDKKDKWKTELGLDDSNSESTDTTIDIASNSYNLWTYVDAMKASMDDNEDLYDMDLDYVDIVDKQIGSATLTLTGVDSIQFVFKFKVGLAAQLNLQSSIKYTYLSDCYTTNGILSFKGNVISDVTTLASDDPRCTGKQVLQSSLNVNVALQGGIGFRFGVAVEVNFSGFQMNSLLSVGIEAEVGPYVELKGFFAYDFNKEDIDMSDRGGPVESYSTSEFKGGAKVDFGIYLEVSATITIVKKWEIGIASYQWPIVDYVIGAWSSDSSAYGDFVDNEETVSMDGNKENTFNVSTMGIQKISVDSKTRSTQSNTLYELETKIGESTSSGLQILKGTLADGSVSAVQLENPDDGKAYSYKIASVTRKTANGGRDLDGQIRYDKVTYTEPSEICKYGHITSDGFLNVNTDCPDAVFEIIVKAEKDKDGNKVINIFTDECPTKTITVNYSGKTASGTAVSHHINFYDTDGNLILTDFYQEGETPVTFPAAGFRCEGTYSNYLQTETGTYHYNGDVTWEKIVGEYWGYNYYYGGTMVSSYDYSSARWTDTPMSSGTEGNVITAASIGGIKNDYNIYLHMDKKAEVSWVVSYVDPDDRRTIIESEVVKTAQVTYRNRSELDALSPVLESKQFDGEKCGAIENVTSWENPRYSYSIKDKYGNDIWIDSGEMIMNMSTLRIKNTYNSEGLVISSTISPAQKKRRTMPNQQFVAKIATASIESYTWGTVTFDYKGQKIQVKTNVGDVPQIPAEYQNLSDICGWTRSDPDLSFSSDFADNYSTYGKKWAQSLTPEPLQPNDANPTYYGALRKGTNVYAYYPYALEQDDGSYIIDNTYNVYSKTNRQIKYNNIGSLPNVSVKDFLRNAGGTPETVGDLYEFSEWIIPSQEEYEMGIIPEKFASFCEATKASDGQYYLNPGQSYPIVAVFKKRTHSTFVFDVDGIGTLSGGGTVWSCNRPGNIAGAFSSDNTTYTVSWTDPTQTNFSKITVPTFTSNGTVPDDWDEDWKWSWKSTEPVNGKHITIQNNTTIWLEDFDYGTSLSITFKPYIETRSLTIQLDDIIQTRKIYGNVGETLTADGLYSRLRECQNIANIYDFVASIKDEYPLPYTFGSKDTDEKKVYEDSITVRVVHIETSEIDLDGGALPDGTDKDLRLTGKETDEIDLLQYNPVYNDGIGYSEFGSVRTKYQFDGWMNTETNQYVTKIHYGENVKAVYSETGKYIENYTLDAGTGTFTQGSTKTIELDLSKTLEEQTGYETPTPPEGYQFMCWASPDYPEYQFSSNTSAQSIWNSWGTSDSGLIAVYAKNSVTADAVNQVYDGLTHSINAQASQAGSTIEYSLTGADGSWSTTEPIIKDVVSETIYVRATHPDLYTTQPIQVSVNITQAPVTVTADNLDKLINTRDPQLTVTTAGMANGESASMIQYTIGRTTGEEEGTYTITVAGSASQGNYTVTYVNGVFTIRTSCNVQYNMITSSEDSPMTTQGVYVMNDGDEPNADTENQPKVYEMANGTSIGTSIPTIWLVYNDTSIDPLNITEKDGVTFGVVDDEGTETSYSASDLADVTVSGDTTINIHFKTLHVTFTAAEENTSLSGDGIVTTKDVYILDGLGFVESDLPDIYVLDESNSLNKVEVTDYCVETYMGEGRLHKADIVHYMVDDVDNYPVKPHDDNANHDVVS